MKSKSTLSINLPKERVLLSEVSPFEVPITFSNRGLYKFSRDNKLSFDLSEQKFKWLHLNDKHDRVVRFILGLPDAVKIEKVDIKGRKYSEIGISKGLKNSKYILGYTIPYNYKIIQKADKKRTLSILHPYSQLMWVSFYDKYKDLIIYYMSKSKASLRKPVKISACKFIDRR